MKIDRNTILIVDDEILILLLLERIINNLGMVSLQAANGEAAWEIFLQEKESIMMVISDQNMPNMTGVELCRKIKEKNSEIPFILISGNLNDKILDEGRQFGVNHFITKPFLVETIISAIEMHN